MAGTRRTTPYKRLHISWQGEVKHLGLQSLVAPSCSAVFSPRFFVPSHGSTLRACSFLQLNSLSRTVLSALNRVSIFGKAPFLLCARIYLDRPSVLPTYCSSLPYLYISFFLPYMVSSRLIPGNPVLLALDYLQFRPPPSGLTELYTARVLSLFQQPSMILSRLYL